MCFEILATVGPEVSFNVAPKISLCSSGSVLSSKALILSILSSFCLSFPLQYGLVSGFTFTGSFCKANRFAEDRRNLCIMITIIFETFQRPYLSKVAFVVIEEHLCFTVSSYAG